MPLTKRRKKRPTNKIRTPRETRNDGRRFSYPRSYYCQKRQITENAPDARKLNNSCIKERSKVKDGRAIKVNKRRTVKERN